MEWIAAGLVIGGGLGFIAGSLSRNSLIRKMQADNLLLQERLFAVHNRDSKGRFTRVHK